MSKHNVNQTLIRTLDLCLANSYLLYLKTQNYHWNVTGPNFKSLHLMFEEQYTDLALAIDTIAERIRSLGSKAPGSFAKYSKIAVIKEGDEDASAVVMIQNLVNDQATIITILDNALKEAQKSGDEVTTGIIADRIEIHQKNAWMLSASL